MTETYVNEYLEERIQRVDYPPEAAAMARVLLRAYRRAIRSTNWVLASEIGGLMIEAANEFKDEPDFPGRFAKP